jgi:hypothetical protein
MAKCNKILFGEIVASGRQPMGIYRCNRCRGSSSDTDAVELAMESCRNTNESWQVSNTPGETRSVSTPADRKIVQ